jgi:hypothetical protein
MAIRVSGFSVRQTTRSFFVNTTDFECKAMRLPGVAAVGCMLSAGNVSAGDSNVKVVQRVSAVGLDFSRPADARTFTIACEAQRG